MKRLLSEAAFRWDLWRARMSRSSAPAWRVYMFHSLFANEAERDSGLAFPHEGITVAQFEEFVRINTERGIRFISPEQLSETTSPKQPAILITFDDGYANNRRALPILEKYQVPALFCITTQNIERQRSFWWDVFYREKVKGDRLKGYSLEERKTFSPEKNEAFLIEKLGPDAMNPVGEVDRPFSIGELTAFAQHPLVHIGNHSHRHPLFTSISEEMMREEIENSQALLEAWTGIRPTIFAYPNGSCSAITERVMRDCGFQYALTTDRKWYSEADVLSFHLGRVPMYGTRDIGDQLSVHEHGDAGWWKR